MPYVSVAVLQPRQEHRTELEEMQDDLLRCFKTLPGFLDGYLMMTSDVTGRVGRVTVWKTRKDADHAAQEQEVLIAQSKMNLLVEDEADIRLEQGFVSIRA
jgi:hypothetical protein